MVEFCDGCGANLARARCVPTGRISVADGLPEFRRVCGDCHEPVIEFPEYHVYPLADLISHELNTECVCGPVCEAGKHTVDGSFGWLVTHHSLDGREANE